jgi:hypothetical protein
MSEPRMPPPADVEAAVRRALMMMVTGQEEPGLFTADVTGQTPLGEVHGPDELRAQVSDWRDGLTDVELTVHHLVVDGTTAKVDWQLDARHTGVVLVNEDLLFEATDHHVTLPVTSEFGLRGARICSFQHDYDLDGLLRQLLPGDPA